MTKYEIMEAILCEWADDVFNQGHIDNSYAYKLYEEREAQAKEVLELYKKAGE